MSKKVERDLRRQLKLSGRVLNCLLCCVNESKTCQLYRKMLLSYINKQSLFIFVMRYSPFYRDNGE